MELLKFLKESSSAIVQISMSGSCLVIDLNCLFTKLYPITPSHIPSGTFYMQYQDSLTLINAKNLTTFLLPPRYSHNSCFSRWLSYRHYSLISQTIHLQLLLFPFLFYLSTLLMIPVGGYGVHTYSSSFLTSILQKIPTS